MLWSQGVQSRVIPGWTPSGRGFPAPVATASSLPRLGSRRRHPGTCGVLAAANGSRELSLRGEGSPAQTGPAAAGPGSPPGWSGWRRKVVGGAGDGGSAVKEKFRPKGVAGIGYGHRAAIMPATCWRFLPAEMAASSSQGRGILQAVEMRTFEELATPDERTLRFTPMGFSTMGVLRPEDATEFQQATIASADLVEAVPEEVRQSYERLRACHTYGVLWYDAFTVAADLSFLVLEQALRTRFVEFYDGSIPVTTTHGDVEHLEVKDFEDVLEGLKRLPKAKGGWKLQLRSGERWQVRRGVRWLLEWAHEEGLLHGQRNKRMEPLRSDMRNVFAHGSYRMGMPNESSRRIRDLAEMINRLWGEPTPGGRLYPAPLHREVMAVGWAHQGLGLSYVQLRPDQIPAYEKKDPGEWTYILIMAVPNEQDLWEFDARYEMTPFPTDFLWGPGSGEEAFAWWQSAAVETDTVDYLDRLFAVRVDEGKTYLAQRPEVLLGLPPQRRAGAWHLLRADFPLDAFNHVRHLPADCRSGGEPWQGCPVEEVATGDWEEVREAVLQATGGSVTAVEFREVWVPRRFPFPSDVGWP